VIAHETPRTFSNTNQAARAFILADPHHAVSGPLHRQSRAHFYAIAALIANLNQKIAFAGQDPDGAFRLVRLFEESLRTSFFTGAAACAFASDSYQFFHLFSSAKKAVACCFPAARASSAPGLEPLAMMVEMP
jgi:phosphoglucomutase